jgi:hypothetical protein
MHFLEADGDALLTDYSLSALEKDEQERAFNELMRRGKLLYRQLFLTAPGDLEKVLHEIENYRFANRPLRITVQENGIYIPWPLLISPFAKGVDDFWGYKFELAVIPTVYHPPTRTLAWSPNDAAPFAVYADDTDFEGVGWFAIHEAARVAKLLKLQKPLLIDSSDRAKDVIIRNRSSIKLLLTYLHATSGIQLTRDRSDEPIRVLETEPRLKFSLNDDLLSSEMLEWLDEQKIGSQDALLESQPIVLLNACESGAQVFSPLSNTKYSLTLPIVLMQLGARGVVATDAPVWKLSAAHLGDNFAASVLKGIRVPEALRGARLELLKHGNPMGLLYSYYGDPKARLILSAN